jgi:hypothetical protein
MSLPEELLSKAEEVYAAFGGLKEAKNLYTPRELWRATIFYGPTITLTNFQTRLEEGIGPLVPVPRLNFLDLGYIPGTKVIFTDEIKNILFETVLTPHPDLTPDEYLWGSGPQLAFIESLAHGTRLFAYLQTEGGGLLGQVLVCKERHPQDITQDVELLKRQVKQVQTQLQTELLFDLPLNGISFKFWFCEAAAELNFDIQKLKENANTKTVEKGPGEILYITPKRSMWFACTNESDALLSLNGVTGPDAWRIKQLNGLFYLQLGRAGITTQPQLVNSRFLQPIRKPAPIRLSGAFS